MKLLVEVVLLGVATCLIINTISPVLGVGRLGINAFKIFKPGKTEDYRRGSDEEYGDYSYYGDYDDDYVEGHGVGHGVGQGHGTASLKNDGGGVNGRRGSFGVSSQFWSTIFHIHEHHHKVIGVNWDANDDKPAECVGIGKSCDSRHECCKNGLCENFQCVECSGEDAAIQFIAPDYVWPGESGSCAKTKKCCSRDHKCVNNKCTNWFDENELFQCSRPWENVCKSKPCCRAGYKCDSNGTCKAEDGRCQKVPYKPCNDLYPCCSRKYRCYDGKCKDCIGLTQPCKSSLQCCTSSGDIMKCILGYCRLPWSQVKVPKMK